MRSVGIVMLMSLGVLGLSREAQAQNCTPGAFVLADASSTNIIRAFAMQRPGDCAGTQIEVWFPGAMAMCTGGSYWDSETSHCTDHDEYTLEDSVAQAEWWACGAAVAAGARGSYMPDPFHPGIWVEPGPSFINVQANCPPPPPDNYCEYEWNYYASNWQCQSPIVANTGGSQNVKFTRPEDGVMFDFNCDGTKKMTSWTEVNSDVAFLTYDLPTSGQVCGRNLLGNWTIAGAVNGFDAAQKINMSLNGGVAVAVIDSTQPLGAKLEWWHDRNHNGVAESSERSPFLTNYAGLLTSWVESYRRDGNGNRYRFQGTLLTRTAPGKNGLDADRTRERRVYDVFLSSVQ